MDGGPEKRGDYFMLLDLMPKKRDWLGSMDENKIYGCLEEKKLELRLGLPGQGFSSRIDSTEKIKERDESRLSLGYVSMSSPRTAQKPFSSSVKSVETVSWNCSPFQAFPSTTHSLPVTNNEGDLQNAEKQAFLPPSSGSASPHNSQKRSAPAPVVGWPPVRSFRKNLTNTTSNSKPSSDVTGGVPSKALPGESPTKACRKGHFVKINVDGVPIGRKVDLSVNDSYEKLSSAIVELFRSLLTARRDEEDAGSTDLERNWGLLDRSGEYTLVYEDNEGDRMLAGDVPWHMFVSTVKRLRVLKSSEISALTLANSMGRQNPAK